MLQRAGKLGRERLDDLGECAEGIGIGRRLDGSEDRFDGGLRLRVGELNRERLDGLGERAEGIGIARRSAARAAMARRTVSFWQTEQS